MTICVALFRGNVGQIFCISRRGENFISHKGRIYISCQRAPYTVNLSKGENIDLMPTCILLLYFISQMGENVYGPMGSYISMHLSMGRICVIMEIIYFRTKCPNEPATVAFLACDGFSHRVFPHEGFNAPV
jgi:hypothetical protein